MQSTKTCSTRKAISCKLLKSIIQKRALSIPFLREALLIALSSLVGGAIFAGLGMAYSWLFTPLPYPPRELKIVGQTPEMPMRTRWKRFKDCYIASVRWGARKRSHQPSASKRRPLRWFIGIQQELASFQKRVSSQWIFGFALNWIPLIQLEGANLIHTLKTQQQKRKSKIKQKP